MSDLPSNIWVVYRDDTNKILYQTEVLKDAQAFMLGYALSKPRHVKLHVVRPWLVPGYVEPAPVKKPTTAKRRGRKRALR